MSVDFYIYWDKGANEYAGYALRSEDGALVIYKMDPDMAELVHVQSQRHKREKGVIR